METFSIPTEGDIKKWIKEAVEECLTSKKLLADEIAHDEPFLNRHEAAALLNISLVTLTDWTKRGLPHYRQRRRIYYFKIEIIEYFKTNYPEKIKFNDRYSDYKVPN